MDIKFENNITTEEFLEIIETVGWKPYTREQLERALKNTMYKSIKEISSQSQDNLQSLNTKNTIIVSTPVNP